MVSIEEDGVSTCLRCHQPFDPSQSFSFNGPPKFCADCQVRNLFDNCDIPTPPELIDPHSKNPALTEDEFRKKVSEVKVTGKRRKR